MSQEQPSAEELKDRIDKGVGQANLGAGDQEPDPATEENPPAERREGDKKRTQT
jgi:hypothetical protein